MKLRLKQKDPTLFLLGNGGTAKPLKKKSLRKGMLRGERRRLLVPAKLGYGRSGAPPAIPPNSNLVFEVELV